MLKVEFYEATPDGYVLCGYLFLKGKKIAAQISKTDLPGNKILFKNITSGSSVSTAEKKLMAKDPEKWLRSLPAKYSGSYMRAELVEDKVKPKV